MDILIDLLLSGKYIAAVGAGMVLAVGALRYGGAKLWPWLGTKSGGYVLAYTCSFALYLGTALQSGASVDAHLLLQAVATAVMSSGVLDHWRDLLGAAKKMPATAGVITSIFVALTVISCSDCAGTKPTGGSVIASVIDCAAPGGDILDRIKLEALKMGAIAFGPDVNKWNEIEVLAVNDGLTIGGCAFAQVVNEWITKKSLSTGSAIAEVHDAKETFEKYRSTYAGGATFKTVSGDL